MTQTTIEWADHTVNPIRARHRVTGRRGHWCEKVSPGCAHCYASRMQRARGTGVPFELQHRDDVEVYFEPRVLQEVLRRRKPTWYFWCDMTDLFGSWVPNAWRDQILATMALTPQHTHLVLSKRAEGMRAYFSAHDVGLRWLTGQWGGTARDKWAYQEADAVRWTREGLPNVWLGVSAEDQATADERIPLLLQAPAAHRFVSLEPLLGPVDLEAIPIPAPGAAYYGLHGVAQPLTEKDTEPDDWKYWTRREAKLDWVIVGGESGPGARPCDVAWIRSIVQQARAAGVPPFVKQLGANRIENGCWHRGHTASLDQVTHRKGGDPAEWPADLRDMREFPQ